MTGQMGEHNTSYLTRLPLQESMRAWLGSFGRARGTPFLTGFCWIDGGGFLGDVEVLLHLKLVSWTQDGWEWGGTPFSVQGVKTKIRDGWSWASQATINPCRL